MPQSKEPFRDPAEPLFEARINELEKGEGVGEITAGKIGTGAVTEAKLGTGAVTEAKLGLEAVTFTKVKPAASDLPAKPAEKAVSAKATSLARQAHFAITGDAAKTEWVCEHGLFTWIPFVQAYEKGAGEKETKKNITVSSVEVESSISCKVTLGSAVAAGVVAYIGILG